MSTTAALADLHNGRTGSGVQGLARILRRTCGIEGEPSPIQIVTATTAVIQMNVISKTGTETIAGIGCLDKVMPAIRSSSTHHLREYRLSAAQCCQLLCRYPSVPMATLVEAAEVLMNLVHDPIPTIRLASLRAFLFAIDRLPTKIPGTIAFNLKNQIPSQLLFIASDTNPDMRLLCAQALALCHPADVSVLLEGLEWESWKSEPEVKAAKTKGKDEPQSLRSRIADATNAVKTENESKYQDKNPLPMSGTSLLAVLLEDEQSTVRITTIQSVCLLGTKHPVLIKLATPFLIDLCYDQCRTVCVQALTCLATWSSKITFTEEQLQVVFDALSSSDTCIILGGLRLISSIVFPKLANFITSVKFLLILLSTSSLGPIYSNIRSSLVGCISTNREWSCAVIPEIVPTCGTEIDQLQHSGLVGVALVVASSSECLSTAVALIRKGDSSAKILLRLWDVLSYIIDKHSDIAPNTASVVNEYLGVCGEVEKEHSLSGFLDLFERKTTDEESVKALLSESVNFLSLGYPSNSALKSWTKSKLAALLRTTGTCDVALREYQKEVPLSTPRISNLCYSKTMFGLFSAQQVPEWSAYKQIGIKINFLGTIKWKNTSPSIALVRPKLVRPPAPTSISRLSTRQVNPHSWEISWRLNIKTGTGGLCSSSEAQPSVRIELAVVAASNELYVEKSAVPLLASKFVKISRTSEMTVSL